MHGTFTFDKFKDNKGVTRRRNSTKNRQYNGQTKQDKQNNTRKTKEQQKPTNIREWYLVGKKTYAIEQNLI